MARAATSDELTKLRSGKQASKLFLAIHTPATVYTARVNQASFTDPVSEVIYDGGSGTLANVLAGMTMYVGSSAGAYDLGMVRIRKTPSATVFYIGETSEIVWADNLYLTVVDEFNIWQKAARNVNNVEYIDYDLAYSDQNEVFNPIPILGPHAVLWLAGGSVSFEPDAGESYVLDSTISGYLWAAAGASATSDLDTATPTITYNAAGTYRVSCTVTAANGKTSVGYRTIFVYDENHMPVTQFELKRCSGSKEEGGWQFEVSVYAEVASVIPGALVILFAKDYYNGEQISLGYLSGYENILAIGRIDEESISMDYEAGIVEMTVAGGFNILNRLSNYAVLFTSAEDEAATWGEFEQPTIDKALFNLLYWRSTVIQTTDVFLSGDTRRMPEVELASDTIWKQISDVANRRMLAEACFDRYDRLTIEVDVQYLSDAERTGIPIAMGITAQDWQGKVGIEIQRAKIAMVELGGIRDDTPTEQLFSRAPGNIFKREGAIESHNDLVFDNQAHANTLSGMVLAKGNNPYPWIDIALASNNRMFDITPNQRLTISVAAGDTPRGIVWNEKKIIARWVSFEFSDKDNWLYTTAECEAETSGVAGVTFYMPPEPIIGTEEIEIPELGGNEWPALIPGGIEYPPYVPPEIPPSEDECPTDAPANGPYQLYIYGEISSASVPSRNGVLHCVIRTDAHEHKTTYQIQGSFQKLVGGVWTDTNDDGFYEVEAVDEYGTVIATGVHDAVTNPSVRTGVLNAVAASEITHIYIRVNDTELLRPQSAYASFIDQAPTSAGTFDWSVYGSGIQLRLLNAYLSGSTIWTGGDVTFKGGAQFTKADGSVYWAAGDIFKIQSWAYLRNEWVSGGGSGLHNDFARLINYRGSLSGSTQVWNVDFSPARKSNGGLWASGMHENYFTIPNTSNKIAVFEAQLHAYSEGQQDSYKVEIVELLMRVWKMSADTHRIVVSQAILWNVCPPEA